MPKIIRILNRLAVGGPVLNATYLTKHLAPDFQTLLLVGQKEGHEKMADHLVEELGIEYITIPEMGRSLNPLNDYKAFKRIKDIILDFKPDIVHTHAAKPGALGRLAAASANVPAIVHTYHGHVFHSYFNSVKTSFFIKAERYLASKSHAIVAISNTQKDELANQFKIAPENKFKVIPLGFNLDKFREDREEKRISFRKEFDVKDDEIAIGIIGRLVPIKNHQLFLQSIHHVFQNTTKRVKAFIIGDGESRSSLELLASKLGIQFSTEKDESHSHTLVFTSWRKDVDVILAGLDIVTLTSFNEGTPVSLIEAQAANKPIVSTRVGGIADVVIEGKTALLSNIDEGEAFCDNLLRMVEDERLRLRMGEGAGSHVFEKYSYQRLVKDMSDLYYELLAEKLQTNAVLR